MVTKLLSQWNHRLTEAELEDLADRAATRFEASPFRAVIDSLGLTEVQHHALMEMAPYPKEREQLFPESRTVLTQLYPRYKLGVVANQRAGTELRLAAWGIRDYFSVVAASAEVGLSKPDRGIFLHAIDMAGCQPKDAAFVGDRLDNDIGPAKQLGCRTIRVLQGIHRLQEPRTKEEIPDLTLATIAHLPNALGSIDLSST